MIDISLNIMKVLIKVLVTPCCCSYTGENHLKSCAEQLRQVEDLKKVVDTEPLKGPFFLCVKPTQNLRLIPNIFWLITQHEIVPRTSCIWLLGFQNGNMKLYSVSQLDSGMWKPFENLWNFPGAPPTQMVEGTLPKKHLNFIMVLYRARVASSHVFNMLGSSSVWLYLFWDFHFGCRKEEKISYYYNRLSNKLGGWKVSPRHQLEISYTSWLYPTDY